MGQTVWNYAITSAMKGEHFGLPDPTIACVESGQVAVPQAFVAVWAGSFTMGVEREWWFKNLFRDVDPVWPGEPEDVTIADDYFLQSTEVTRQQWAAVMDTAPSFTDDCGDDCPIGQVNWYEVLAYANALSRAEGIQECYVLEGCTGEPGAGCTGDERWPNSRQVGSCDDTGSYVCSTVEFSGFDCLGYRLPSAAEWEWAARAGLEIWKPSERELNDACGPPIVEDPRTGRFTERRKRDAPVHSVTAHVRNPLGFYGLLDNAHEWVWTPLDMRVQRQKRKGPSSQRAELRFPSCSMGRPYEYDVHPGWFWDEVNPKGRTANVGFRLARTIRCDGSE